MLTVSISEFKASTAKEIGEVVEPVGVEDWEGLRP
jgi:hypothetical protein